MTFDNGESQVYATQNDVLVAGLQQGLLTLTFFQYNQSNSSNIKALWYTDAAASSPSVSGTEDVTISDCAESLIKLRFLCLLMMQLIYGQIRIQLLSPFQQPKATTNTL